MAIAALSSSLNPSPILIAGAIGGSSSSTCSCRCLPLQRGYGLSFSQFSSTSCQRNKTLRHPLFIRVAAETAEAVATSTGLTMNLKVEGTLAESMIPKVTDVLKKVEGIANLKVYTSEGVATVELEKQTTIQATGEASSLLEKIQREGFKLQNLCISFDDETAGTDDDIAYEYESTS